MIQFSRFTDGCYVLHKVTINGHKYSAWYGKDGALFSAERFSKNGQTTYNVPFTQVNVVTQLNKIGARYINA